MTHSYHLDHKKWHVMFDGHFIKILNPSNELYLILTDKIHFDSSPRPDATQDTETLLPSPAPKSRCSLHSQDVWSWLRRRMCCPTQRPLRRSFLRLLRTVPCPVPSSPVVSWSDAALGAATTEVTAVVLSVVSVLSDRLRSARLRK